MSADINLTHIHADKSWVFGSRAATLGMKNTAWLIAVPVLITLSFLVLPPIWILLRESFTDEKLAGSAHTFTFAHYIGIFTGRNLLIAAKNSIIFATLATAVSLILGGILAWIVERTNAPFKSLAYLAAFISMGTPYIIFVSAWLFLFGKAGPFNVLYRQVFGTTESLFNVYSMWGMVLVEGFLWSPLIFMMLSATFRVANAEMEEAARISGASVIDTVRHISLKIARPAIYAMALFAFIRNLEAFEVPVLIGMPGEVTLLTTAIYLSITQLPPLFGHASAFSVLLLLMLSVLLYFYGKLSNHAQRYATIVGKGYRPRAFKLGGYRWLAGAFILVNFTIIVLLPISALLWSSFSPFIRPFSIAGLNSLTARNYEAVFNAPEYIHLAVNTFVTAAGSATVVIFLALLTGWLAARRKPFGKVLDQLATIPLVFPGIVLGVAMIEIGLGLPIPIYGTLWLIAAAFIIRYLPYGLRYTYAGVLQIHIELEDAAKAAGANTISTLRYIIAPLLSPAVISGWLFVFFLASKELSVAVLLGGPNSQMMSVAMFDLSYNGQSGELSALGLVWMLPMVALTSLFYVFARRQSVGTFGR